MNLCKHHPDLGQLIPDEWLEDHIGSIIPSLITWGRETGLITRCITLQAFHVPTDDDGCFTLPNGECIGPACGIHR